MYVNCISCGHKFDIGKSYDDYEGPVRCPTCRATLTIRTEDGNLRAVRPGFAAVGLSSVPREEADQNAEPVAGSIQGYFSASRRNAA